MKKTVCCLLLFTSIAVTAQNDINYLFIARNTGIKVLSSQDTIRIFGFAQSLGEFPSVPGPTIIANEGDSVHIDLFNVSQGAPHTIHLHGLDVDQQNDGVPNLSFEVEHMDHGFYHFKAPHAGTYLYHCHVASPVHVQAGMYGAIIIKPTDGSNTTWNGGHSFDYEFSYFLSEIDTVWHRDTILDHDHDTTQAVMLVNVPKYNPQFYLINGFSDQQLVDENVTLNSNTEATNYVRLTNVGYCGTRVIFPSELNAMIIDSDGRPLPQVEYADTITVLPGERYGVICKSTTSLTGNIEFEYFNLNTYETKNTQIVPVNIVYTGLELLSDYSYELKITPNPFTSGVNLLIVSPEAIVGNVQITNIEGRIVFQKAVSLHEGENNIKLSLDELPSGSYIVSLNNRSGVLMTQQKMIKSI